jgi:mannose-6-phosphate isomerase-like protein (cupin superfamily)
MGNSQYHYPTETQSEFYIDEGCHIVEILNRSTHPDISISQARVEPGMTTENHFLEGTVEIYYILQGRGTAYIGDQTIAVKPSDLIYIPTGVEQYISNDTDEDLLFLCICTPRWQEHIYKTP